MISALVTAAWSSLILATRPQSPASAAAPIDQIVKALKTNVLRSMLKAPHAGGSIIFMSICPQPIRRQLVGADA
jgi:hypothetical protein